MQDRARRSKLHQDRHRRHHRNSHYDSDRAEQQRVDRLQRHAAGLRSQFRGENKLGRPEVARRNPPEKSFICHGSFLDVDPGETQLEQMLDRQPAPAFRHADHDAIRMLRGDHPVQIGDAAQPRRAGQLFRNTAFAVSLEVADRGQAQFRAASQAADHLPHGRRRSQEQHSLRSQRLPHQAGERDPPRRQHQQNQHAAIDHQPFRKQDVPAAVAEQRLQKEGDAEHHAKLLHQKNPGAYAVVVVEIVKVQPQQDHRHHQGDAPPAAIVEQKDVGRGVLDPVRGENVTGECEDCLGDDQSHQAARNGYFKNSDHLTTKTGSNRQVSLT